MRGQTWDLDLCPPDGRFVHSKCGLLITGLFLMLNLKDTFLFHQAWSMTESLSRWMNLLKDWKETLWTSFTSMHQIITHPLRRHLKLSINFTKVIKANYCLKSIRFLFTHVFNSMCCCILKCLMTIFWLKMTYWFQRENSKLLVFPIMLHGKW